MNVAAAMETAGGSARTVPNKPEGRQRSHRPGNKLNVNRRLGVFTAEVRGRSGLDGKPDKCAK